MPSSVTPAPEKKPGIAHLALVDRSKTRKYWWISNQPNLIQIWTDHQSALDKVKTLSKNNARVVTSVFAKDLIQRQRDNISASEEERRQAREHEECMADLSWDAHKNC